LHAIVFGSNHTHSHGSMPIDAKADVNVCRNAFDYDHVHQAVSTQVGPHADDTIAAQQFTAAWTFLD
jgi:hypothetical protein